MIRAKTEKSAAPFAADDADKIAFLYLPINSFLSTGKNRDRGEPHGSAPPTPPCVRVRTRRFDGFKRSSRAAMKGAPSLLKKALVRAMDSAGLLLSRQGPWGLPAVCAARSLPTPWRRNAAKRVRPRFHCRQTKARSRRLIHWSRRRKTEGVSQKPK